MTRHEGLMAGRTATILGLILALPNGAEEDFFPLGEGYAWASRATVLREGKKIEMEAMTRVVGRRKIGGVECFSLEIRVGGGVSREFLAADGAGVWVYGGSRDGGEFFYNPPIQRLRYPLVAGAAWEIRARGGAEEVTIRSAVRGEEEVEVPAGRYRAVKVSAVAETPAGKMETLTWYARGVGVVRQWVRQTHTQGGLELTVELKTLEGSPPRRP